MVPTPSVRAPFFNRFRAVWWMSLMGAWLGLTLVKLGNPVILDNKVQPPTDFLELVFQPWPLRWGWGLLGVLLLLGLGSRQWSLRVSPNRWLAAPLVWLIWQWVAASTTVDLPLSTITLAHFTVCTILFYLGLFSPQSHTGTAPIFWGILLGFLFVVWVGFDQHFGGLEATRMMVSEQVGWENLPKEYLKRLRSDRIFATLVYPNALAGAILLCLPVLIVFVFRLLYRYSFVVLAVPVGMLAYFGVACMVWSGSKAGWLLSLLLLTVWVWHLKPLLRWRTLIVALVALVGVSLFAVKYSSYFQKGATSVGARVDYWSAAVDTLKKRPILGSGPGTFSIMYRAVKSPESEMALLAHNDYLQQGSDSGIVGMLLYFCIFPAGVIQLYRKSRRDNLTFVLWLGLLGWTLQGFVEFGLYIPALSGCSFFFLGWLHGVGSPTMRCGFDTKTGIVNK